MLEVKIYKIVDAGHFYCKPFSRDKIQAEKYYTLIGKINDYCSRAFDQTNNPRSSLPSKGQICLVKRTSDRCWYRARILSVFQTINGPQVRVLLVDLGERTLVPGLWVQEIPEDFLDIPFQTMECVLSGLKPVSLAISYFDLTTTKQPGDSWDVAASEWFKKQINGCNIQLDVKHIDEDGVHHVLLFATGSAGMICLNDELVNKEFAVPSRTVDPIKQGTNKSPFTKERSQDVFLQEHKDAIKQLNSSLAAESDRSDSSDSFQRPPRSITRGRTQPTEPNTKYQPITSSEVFPGWSNSTTRSGAELDGPINGRRSGLSSDEESSKVRFLSARLPATGSSPFPDTSIGTRQKELRPILKTSSGHSSGEQEESARDTATRGERFPRHVESSYRPSFGHGVEVCRRREEENVLSLSVPHRNIVNPETLGRNMNEHSLSTQKNFSIPPKPQNVLYTSDVVSSRNLSRPPNALQSLNNTTTITPPLSQTVPYSSSQFSYASPTSLPQNSFVSTSPSSVAGPPQVQSNTKSSLPSQHAPTRLPQSLFVSPTSSSLSPRVPSTNVSQSQRSQVTSSSQSPRVPTPSPSKPPRVTTAGSSSPPGVTPSPSKSRRVPSSPLPCASLCRVSKDVFIHGEGPPRVISQLDTDAFPDVVLRVLRDMCVTTPSSFQSNIWPAVLRGRDVCGIPETHAENSLGYLVPVLTEISEPAVYSELPLGNGPLALIICAGWRKASAVYVQCCKFAKKIRNIRVECIFGAGAEEEYILHLINGCEVLIATLPCFLRMFKKGYTRLDRLCHLVLDDADILAEDQTELVKELMRAYGGYLQSQPDRLAPRQCIVMANKWTPGVRSLVKVYLGNPLIIIGNSVETAMFCKVRQTVKMISASKRDSHIVGLLDSLTTDVDHEIIIFTSAAKDAEHIAELLQYDSYSVLLAHEFLYSEQLVEVRRQWNTPHSSQSYPVLVMTDGVIDKCFIRNSSCVIHYDFPHSEKLFGKRLFCMAANYPSTEERECLSHILGTEHTSNYAQRMKQILTRAGGEVPAVLESVSNMAIEAKEECKKNSLLCYSLKALGVCKYMNTPSCKERHTVFPDADVSILLPRSGLVKVLVLRVMDACRYYVRILERQSDCKEPNTDSSNCYSGATFLKLALDLNAWYALPQNRQLCAKIKPHKLCVAYSEGSYYRVCILRVVEEDPETNRATKVKVYFVDRGEDDDISTRYLLETAPQFVDIPYQAVEAFVCRIQPVDNEKEWTNKSCRFVRQHIEGKELEGKVVMGLGNAIWLDPLVVKTYLKEINVTANTFNVRMDLLKEGLAIANPQHIENLRKHFETFVTVKQLTGKEVSERSMNCAQQVETATLPEEKHEMVVVPAVVNPGLFYVRLDANSDNLQDLVDLINEEVQKPLSERGAGDLAIGSVCVARFSEDNKWYRAKIFSIRPEGEYDVFYVDYGDREWISKDRIVPAWPELLQLPFQAIECSLVNISPLGNEWTEEDGDALLDITLDKLLYAKVKSKSAALFAGTCRYGIELCDTSTERDVLISHELVLAGHAQATLESYKALFPEAFESTKNSGEPKEHYEEIPDICLQLYKAQDPNIKIQCANAIKNMVLENTRKKDAIRESGGVRCICRLLGVSKVETVQEYIVISLAFLAAQNDLNCDEIRREGGLKALCCLLNQTTNVKVHEHTAWALKNLAAGERNRDTIREYGGITNLCHLLKTTNNEKVQDNICWAIVAICADNNKNCDAVREAGGLDTLFALLKTTCNSSVLENVMWAISQLACNCKNKKLIGEQGGIEVICSLIETNRNEKVFKNAVRSLKTLSSYNDENRETMCRLGMIDVMRRFTAIPNMLPFDTRRTCLDLIQRLLGRTPDIPLIEAAAVTPSLQEPIRCKPIHVSKKKRSNSRTVNGEHVNGVAAVFDDDDLPPLEDTAEYLIPAVHPMTMWSQTKRFITLSIKLRGVLHKETTISDRAFYFRTKHMEKVYELNLEFFDTVLPKDSKVHVRGSEVLVNLKKAQPSTWQRLLASAEKPPYLSIDFDRWDTGSSDDGDIPRPRTRVSLTKSTKANKLDYTMLPDPDESDSEITDDEDDTWEQFFDFS